VELSFDIDTYMYVVWKKCDEGLVCWQRDRLEAVPGCEGGEEADSRTDYCIDESYVNGGSSNTDLNSDNNSNAYPVIINGLDVAGESYVDIYPEERTSGGGNDFMSNYNLPVASTSTDSSGNKEPVEQKNDASSDNNNRIPPRDYIPITPESEIPSESSSVISPISLWKLGTSRCTLFSVVLAIALILT